MIISNYIIKTHEKYRILKNDLNMLNSLVTAKAKVNMMNQIKKFADYDAYKIQ